MTNAQRNALIAFAVLGFMVTATLMTWHNGYDSGVKATYSPAVRRGIAIGFEQGLNAGFECGQQEDGCAGKEIVLFESPL